MSDIGDDEWFKALAGQPSADLPHEVIQEIAALREAIKSESERDVSTPEETDRQIEQLLFRLRSEGLLQPRTRWKGLFAVPLAAAAVLVIAVSVVYFLPRQIPEQEITRGEQNIQVIETRDVDKSLVQVSETLRSAGIEPKTYPLGMHHGLDASIPAEKRDALRPSLEKFGIKLPVHGELHLEIRQKSGG